MTIPYTLPLDIDVNFYLDGMAPTDLIDSVSVPISLTPVAPEIVWFAGPAGGHIIFVVIDPLNNYTETSESNNVASLSVMVVANRPPVANAGPDQNVFRNTPTTLDGTGSSDPDNDPLRFFWAQTSGPPVGLNGATTAQPDFVPSTPGVYTFELTVFDDLGSYSDDVTNVTVTNRDPVANAGPDASAVKRTLVVLDGTGSSDPDGDALAYSWIQTAGPPVILAGLNTARPSFIPVTKGIYSFQLTVNDGGGGIDSDVVQITVTNTDPVADAGPGNVVPKRSLVVLDGSYSFDADGDPLLYAWTQTGGPAVVISGADKAIASFVPAVSGSYSFDLDVDDGDGGLSTDAVTFTVTNSGPVANAGADRAVWKNTLVVLNGYGSYDNDNDALAYSWSQTAGPSVILYDAGGAAPSFTPNRSGVFTFSLTVDDGDGGNSTDTVNITANNRDPVAHAGQDRVVQKNAQVMLDGTGSHDLDMDPLTFSWSQTGGPSVTLTGADTATPTFFPAVAGVYIFELTVDDGDGGTAINAVQITVQNRAPTANAGADKVVRKKTLVALDGTGSTDPDNDGLGYSWSQSSGPTVTLSNADTASPTFMPISTGTYVFRLTVDDGDGGTSQDTVTITAWGLSPVPGLTANSSTALVGVPIRFDASLSSDPDGNIINFEFKFGDGSMADGTETARDHSYSSPGRYTVTVTITDDDGNTSSTSLAVTINPVPTPPAPSRDLLADIWWLLIVVVVLVVVIVFLAIERQKWKSKATKTPPNSETGTGLEQERN